MYSLAAKNSCSLRHARVANREEIIVNNNNKFVFYNKLNYHMLMMIHKAEIIILFRTRLSEREVSE